MSPGTFVAGEAASVAPVAGQYHRSTYLPPNGAANAAFLEALRLMLVHEHRDRSGRPVGLELAFATPRAWLEPGRRIVARRLPTSFGPLSFELGAEAGSVRALLELPRRGRARVLRLRVRLPAGRRIAAVTIDGAPFGRFDPASGTIELPPLGGRHELAARVVPG